MHRVLSLVTFLAASNAFAVAPQFWRVHTADELLSGEIDGFVVTARGELRPGPGVKKIASFPDPFVLSQAAGANGDRFFGTGNDGKIYRLRGGETKVIFTAPEPEVYSLAFRDGALYAATSPNGKVYRIDPSDGKSTVVYEPKQAYIWDIEFLPGGDLLVATGVEGKLFRVSPKGEARLLFTAPETHARALAVRQNGSILLGGSGKGRIYEIAADGSGHALYDSSLSEISTIYVDPSGVAWASGAASSLPSAPPAPKTTKPATAASSTATAGEQKKDGETGSAPPEVGMSFDDPSASSSAGSGELYRIERDGFVAVVRKFEREMIYAIAQAPDGGLMLATGPQGRIYSFRDGEIALAATVPQKQVVSVSSTGGSTIVTTTNSGAVYELDTAPGAKAEYRSAAKDVERYSRFGQYRIEGTGVSRDQIAVAFRSGNTRTPDSTWSPWSQPVQGPEGAVNAPPGRYLQWKLIASKATPSMVIDAITVSFLNRNVAPVIDAVSVAEPAVIFISSAYPASQVVEATNPDEHGIFTSLDSPREKNDPGKKVYRKGFRTITWRAHDDNGDNLRFSLAFRREGSSKWLKLRENIEESQINFDTSQLPDGRYDLKLTATDANDNPDAPLADVKHGVELRVDNTPPAIAISPAGDDVAVLVTDAMSPVAKVEYSVDAEKWLRATPADGISDSASESYSFPRSAVAGKFVIVRAIDAFFNVSTASLNVP